MLPGEQERVEMIHQRGRIGRETLFVTQIKNEFALVAIVSIDAVALEVQVLDHCCLRSYLEFRRIQPGQRDFARG